MKKYILKLHHRLLFKVFLIFAAGVVFIVVVAFWQIQKISERLILDQLRQQQLTLVNTAAKGIEEYLQSRSDELRAFETCDDLNSCADKYFQQYIKSEDRGISGIAVVNKEGKIVTILNPGNIQTGMDVDVSDRDYFQFLKNPDNRGKIYLTEPIIVRAGSYQGEPLVSLITASYTKDNSFNGLVMLGIIPQYFADNFILPMKLDTDSKTFIVNSSGKVLSNGYDVLIGQSLFDYAKDLNWPQKEDYLNKLTQLTQDKADGFFDWYWVPPGSHSAAKKIVAYTPLTINGENNKWILFVSTPDTVLYKHLGLLEFYYNLILIVNLGLFLVLFIIYTLTMNIAKKDGYEQAYKELTVSFKNVIHQKTQKEIK